MNQASKVKPNMKLERCESSQIYAIGHCSVTNTLGIQFHGKKGADGEREPGTIYHYGNFTLDDWAKFNAAESKGAHFANHVKGDFVKHPFERQELVEPNK